MVCQNSILTGFTSQVKQINEAACKLVCEAVEFDHHALVAASISRTPTYLASGDKEAVKNEFKKQLMVFKEQHLDVIICEVSLLPSFLHVFSPFIKFRVAISQTFNQNLSSAV